MAPLARDNKSLNFEQAKHAAILKELLKLPDNKVCGDCKRNDARWASTNIGVFVCIRCSGIHRGMGVHISRVKSVDLDTWTAEQIENIQKWGNKRANLYWEAHLKKGHQPPEHKMESFIRSKYESKRWAMEGRIPDPETLDAGSPSGAVAGAGVDVSNGGQKTSLPARTDSKTKQSIDLLSGAGLGHPAPPVASTAHAAPKSAATSGGLFDLDFGPSSAAAPAAAAPAAPRSNKADILSLFNQMPPQPAQPLPQATVPSAPPSNTMTGSFAGLNLGPSPPAASNPWGAPMAAPSQSQTSSSLFNSQDVWGSTAQATGSTLFDGGESGISSTKPKQPDLFDNLWR